MNIPSVRLHNQHLVGNKFTNPTEVIEHFGAIQAQEYYGAKWSLKLRLKNTTDEALETAFNNGDILRTHVMRPTWHFVSPQDIRWLLALTAPRVHAFNGYYYRKSGLDKSIFAKSTKIIEKALAGKKQLNRNQLNTLLKEAKIPTDQLGLSYTIMQAELDGVICSGPRIGKQFTYMLLEERVPSAKTLSHDEALQKLVYLFFTSHGPATVQDCVWWSGLTSVDIKAGLEMNKSTIVSEVIDDKTYWFKQNSLVDEVVHNSVILLPIYDEYTVAYKDRSAIYEATAENAKLYQDGYWNSIISNGTIIGSWRKTTTKNTVEISPRFFRPLDNNEQIAFEKTAKEYGEFLGMKTAILYI